MRSWRPARSRTAPEQHQGQHRRAFAASARRRPRAVRRGGQGHGRDRALRDLQGLGTHRQPIDAHVHVPSPAIRATVLKSCLQIIYQLIQLVTEQCKLSRISPRSSLASPPPFHWPCSFPRWRTPPIGRSAAEIQAEIDRLTLELEAQKQELAATQAARPRKRVAASDRGRTAGHRARQGHGARAQSPRAAAGSAAVDLGGDRQGTRSPAGHGNRRHHAARLQRVVEPRQSAHQ